MALGDGRRSAPYIHNGGYGALFGAVVASLSPGAVLVLVRPARELWWRYVLVATLLVPIPAALTVDRYNAIRLAALPVFALVLAIPALDALLTEASDVAGPPDRRVSSRWRSCAVRAVPGQYRTRGPARTVLFEAA